MPHRILPSMQISDTDSSLIIGFAGFILSFIFENIFELFRWLAVILPVLYTAWKWRKEYNKSKEDK